MKQYMLLLLLLPMISFGMQDPREDHNPLEDGMWTQVCRLAKARIKNNCDSLVGTGIAIGIAINDAQPLDHIDLVWNTDGTIDHEKSLQTGGYAPNGDPLVSPVKATLVTIGILGALKVASEVYGLTEDILNLRKTKEMYLKAKQIAISNYDAHLERIKIFLQHTEEISWQ